MFYIKSPKPLQRHGDKSRLRQKALRQSTLDGSYGETHMGGLRVIAGGGLSDSPLVETPLETDVQANSG